jgi:predicted secreted protein
VLAAAVVLALAVAAAACSGDEPDASTSSTLDGATSQATAPSVACYTVDQADPTGPITVSIGAQFAIVLDAEPSTGYSWQPVDPVDPGLLLTIGTEFRGPNEACDLDTETQVLRFVGRAPGRATISLRYSRPTAAADDDRMVTFTVDVVDPTTTTTPPPSIDTTSIDATTTTAGRATTTTKARSTTTTTRSRATTTTEAETTPTSDPTPSP